VRVEIDNRFWIKNTDVDGDCVSVSDPSPIVGAVKDKIFTAFTANGLVPMSLIDATVYNRFEDVRELLLTDAQLVTASETVARNRMCGLDVIKRDPNSVPLLPLLSKREVAAFTWPRDSYARDGVTCGSIESGAGGYNSQDRLNLDIDFGIVLGFHVSNDYEPLDWAFNEYVVLFDRCGYIQIRFYPDSGTICFVVERNDNNVDSIGLPQPVGANNFYFIIASYQWRTVFGVQESVLRLGFLDSATLAVSSVDDSGSPGTKKECSARPSPLGSVTLLSDWRGQHQATTEAIGTIISARVDNEVADWDKSYFGSQILFDIYLFNMCSGALLDGAGAGIILPNEPGTVWNINPRETQLISDKSEGGGYDVTCRGNQWEIVDVEVPRNFDVRCYAYPHPNAFYPDKHGILEAGDLRFWIWVPYGVGDITLEDINFRLFDNNGNEEDITSDRIKNIKKAEYAGTLFGRGQIPDLAVQGYKVTLNDSDLGLANNYICDDVPYTHALTYHRRFLSGPYPENNCNFAFMQKLDHTRQSLGLISASVGNICFSKKLIPQYYYKLAYLAYREDAVNGDTFSIDFAYSRNLVDWFVNQRSIPLHSTSDPISKIFLSTDGRHVALFVSNDTDNTIDLIKTDDETGFDSATFENVGPVLFPRPGKYDENGVSAPSVSKSKAGLFCLVHEVENAAGELGFGRVYSSNFFVWNSWNRRRAEESFYSNNNNLMDEVSIRDPSRFFDNASVQYMAYTGEDIVGVFSILFAKLIEEDEFADQDLAETVDGLKIYDISNKCRGLFDYRHEEKFIIAIFGAAIFRDNNEGNFRLIRTHFRIIADLIKTIGLQVIPVDEYFIDESFSHAVIVTGSFPNQKYFQSMDYTTFLGKGQCEAPFGTGPFPLGVTAGGSLTVGNSYKYKLSWESATIEGNVSAPSVVFDIVAAGFRTATFNAKLPYIMHGGTRLEDHDRDLRINIYRKEWLTGPGNEPDPLDLTNEHYFFKESRAVVAADWLTAESFVVIRENGALPAPTTRLPYFDGHEVGHNARFCLDHPSSNRLLLFFGTEMWFSDTEFKEAFPVANVLNLDDGTGDYIMGVALWRDDAYIFFSKKVIKVVFRGDSIYPQIISRSMGVISSRSIAPSPVGVFALTNDGIRILSDTGWSEDISRDIKPYIDDAILLSNDYFPEDIESGQMHADQGVYASPGAFFDDKYYLDIMEKTNCPRIRLVYSIKKKTWSVHEEFKSGVLLSVLSGERKLLWGTAVTEPSGHKRVFRVGGVDDNGIPVQARAITKEFDLGRLDLFKQFYEIFPSIDAENGSMLITVICDRGVVGYISMFATPERVAFFDFAPTNNAIGFAGGPLAAAGPLGLAIPELLIPTGLTTSRSKRRAVLPDTMIGKKVSFEFFDNGKGAPSEIKAISFSFTFEDSEL